MWYGSESQLEIGQTVQVVYQRAPTAREVEAFGLELEASGEEMASYPRLGAVGRVVKVKEDFDGDPAVCIVTVTGRLVSGKPLVNDLFFPDELLHIIAQEAG